MTLTYNQQHIQVAEAGVSPTFVDVNGAIALTPTAAADSTDVRGDGVVWATVFAALSATVDMSWLQTNFAVLSEINGGEITASGTGATLIDRYELPGSYMPPAVVVSGWEPNIAADKSPDQAGLRTTLPNVSFSPATKASGQETVGEWSVSGSVKPDANDVMFIYELLATAPTVAAGVIPVLLEAPAAP